MTWLTALPKAVRELFSSAASPEAQNVADEVTREANRVRWRTRWNEATLRDEVERIEKRLREHD